MPGKSRHADCVKHSTNARCEKQASNNLASRPPHPPFHKVNCFDDSPLTLPKTTFPQIGRHAVSRRTLYFHSQICTANQRIMRSCQDLLHSSEKILVKGLVTAYSAVSPGAVCANLYAE